MMQKNGSYVLGCLAFGLLVGMPLSAQTQEQTQKKVIEAAPPPAAYLNTETGQVTVQKAEGSASVPLTKDVLNAMRTDSDGLALETTATGAQKLDLKGRFRHVIFGKIGPDGKVETECTNGIGVTGVEAAAKAFEVQEAARAATGNQ